VRFNRFGGRRFHWGEWFWLCKLAELAFSWGVIGIRTPRNRCGVALAFAASAVLALSWCLPMELEAQGSGGSKFSAPDFEKKLFDLDSVFLETGEQRRATDALAAVASNFPSDPKVGPALQAKALALALRIDGVHREASSALGKLINGETPDRVDGFDTPQAAAAALWEVAEALDVSDAGNDDRLLACYLMDIAVRIDPDREQGLERFQRLSLKGGYSGWKGVVGSSSRLPFKFPRDPGGGGKRPRPDRPRPDRPGPGDSTGNGSGKPPGGGNTKPPIPVPPATDAKLVRMEAVGRLIALNPDRRPAAGIALPVQATAIVGELDTPMTVRFLDIDGEQIPGLAKASAFVPGAVAASGVAWPKNGGSITVTIGGKYDAQNRDGIALTAGLLARCMVTGGEFEGEAAAAGGLDEDGTVEALRDPLSLLRGLGATEVPIVILPSANLPQLLDLALIGDLSAFLQHQIFVVPDLATASSLVVGRSDETSKARQLFREIQDLARTMPAGDLVANSKVQERLAEIAELAPTHGSARVLLLAGRSELPAQMSRIGSVYLLKQAAAPVLRSLDGDGDPFLENANSVFGPSKTTLRTTRPTIHPDGVPVSDALSDLIEKIEAYSGLNTRDSEKGRSMADDIKKSWAAVRAAFRTLRTGKAPPEEPIGTESED
jgi:hypothetical protein